uniref:Uncharacterized protein n=1 Tax=Arundo donax TaxID=35708 RepID=A0A0A9EU88_ARUDO
MDSGLSVIVSLDGPETTTIVASDLLEASLTDLRDEGTNSSAFGFNTVLLFIILNFLSSMDILLMSRCISSQEL